MAPDGGLKSFRYHGCAVQAISPGVGGGDENPHPSADERGPRKGALLHRHAGQLVLAVLLGPRRVGAFGSMRSTTARPGKAGKRPVGLSLSTERRIIDAEQQRS